MSTIDFNTACVILLDNGVVSDKDNQVCLNNNQNESSENSGYQGRNDAPRYNDSQSGGYGYNRGGAGGYRNNNYSINFQKIFE